MRHVCRTANMFLCYATYLSELIFHYITYSRLSEFQLGFVAKTSCLTNFTILFSLLKIMVQKYILSIWILGKKACERIIILCTTVLSKTFSFCDIQKRPVGYNLFSDIFYANDLQRIRESDNIEECIILYYIMYQEVI